MTTKIILLATLLSYSIIVSQSFMYILALKDVQLNLDAESYTEFRKLVDASMRSNFKYAVYAALISSLLLAITSAKDPISVQFITSVIAFVALVIDTLITVKGSLPINDVINTWTPGHYPADWTTYRTKWLEIFSYRQMVNIAGFLSLLAGTVLRVK